MNAVALERECRDGELSTLGEALRGESGPSREQIQEYVWARYVKFGAAPFDLDEERALVILENHYRHHPLNEDAESQEPHEALRARSSDDGRCLGTRNASF